MKGLYIQSYGCQMNSSDSDRMEAVLAPLNYERVGQVEEADLILVNTCSIREKAEKKTFHFGRDLQQLKKEKPSLQVGVTGCVAQQEKEAILKDLPLVDFVLGPDHIDELPWVLNELQSSEEKIVRTEFLGHERLWKTKTLIKNPGVSTFINVMKGCDHFCSYCIVPWTRGREKSRPISDIIEDVQELCVRGVKEVTFLGQNINTFGKRNQENLAELFYAAHEVKELERIRFTTSHPGDLEENLIECFSKLPKLCSYFHLPFQSGSDSILRSMRRFYTIKEYREKVAALRAARPDIALSTDVIVGFPGETEEDFQKSVDLLEEIRFDNVYSFAYSQRPGTSAAKRVDQVSDPIKAARLQRLQEVARRISKEEHEKMVGHEITILLEGLSKKKADFFTGRSSQNVPVHIPVEAQYKAGDLVRVKVNSGHLTHLKASAVAPSKTSTCSPSMSLQ